MGLLDRFRRTAMATEVAALREQVRITESNAEIAQEDLTGRLELALEDEGWVRLTAEAQQELTRAGRVRAAEVSRVMLVANPLLKRGVEVRNAYIWGSGVQVSARAAGNDGSQDVNAVIQRFWDDPSNQASFTGDQAQEELERAHATDGNTFLACFTARTTGRVQVRSIPYAEIVDIICNPDDVKEPWYYKREWTATELDLATGIQRQEGRVAYYPALWYQPQTRPRTIGGAPVVWTAPIYHTSVNRLDGWRYGIGDVYAGLRWARGYSVFLDDWATLVKALSRYAWQYKAKRGHAAAKRRIAAAPVPDPRTGKPAEAGATALVGDESALTAIPKTGATIDSESGRPLASMVAATLGIPVTALLSDPGQTGARAVAETLDQPTRLTMRQRRSLWTATYRQICAYVIAQAVRAPRGGLRGSIVHDDYTRRDTVVLDGDTDTTIDVVWPPLDEVDPAVLAKAISDAAGTGTLPPQIIARLLLQAFGVDHIDEILDDLTDDQGNFRYPESPGAGQAAVDAFRRGEDPAAALVGDDEQPDADTADEQGGGGGDHPADAAPRRRRTRRAR